MNKQCPKCAEAGRDTSENGLKIYPDGTGFCFKCRSYFPKEERKVPMSSLTIEEVQTYPFGTSPERKVPEKIAKKYGVRYSTSTTDGKVDTIYYPHYSCLDNKLSGYKVRKLPKDFRPCVGKIGKGMFGRQTCESARKFLIITEGEEDCLAAASMLTASHIDIVGLPNGAGMSSVISDESDLFSKYERIYLIFDPDPVGKKASTEIANFIAPITEVRVVELEGGDVSDYLVAGKDAEFRKAISASKAYNPEEIVNGIDIKLSDLLTPIESGCTIPFAGVQDKLMGLRKGEITTVCAGSGIGKSTFVREIAKSLIEEGYSIANIALEDRMEDAAKQLIALDMNIPFYRMKFHPPPEDEVEASYKKMVANGRTFFYKHFAGITAAELMPKLYYYARSKAVDYIFLDHLSMVVSATDTLNERKTIDSLMTELAKMVVETGVGLVQVVHLRRAGDNRSYAKGGEVELTDLRGSAALEQLSWNVIALERDQQGDSKDFSKVRILKNRTVGLTGIADHLKYDTTTGRMFSVELSDIEGEEDESEGSTSVGE